ncbi:MAG: hypothetical protein FWF59_12145 [Turicibacter sp.]|nr:hypothetical protein [Turicibacter sp.]
MSREIAVTLSEELYESVQRAVDNVQETIWEKYGIDVPRGAFEMDLMEVFIKVGLDAYWDMVAEDSMEGLTDKPEAGSQKLRLIKKGER